MNYTNFSSELDLNPCLLTLTPETKFIPWILPQSSGPYSTLSQIFLVLQNQTLCPLYSEPIALMYTWYMLYFPPSQMCRDYFAKGDTLTDYVVCSEELLRPSLLPSHHSFPFYSKASPHLTILALWLVPVEHHLFGQWDWP